MRLYINDKSIHSQFDNRTFTLACNRFLDLLIAIKKIEVSYQIILCKSFYNRNTIQEEVLASSIKRSRDLNLRWIQIFQTFSYKYWSDSPRQKNGSSYLFKDEEFWNTILADISEDKYANRSFHLSVINFLSSKFGETSFEMIRVEGDNRVSLILDAFTDQEGLKKWLESKSINYPNLKLFEHNPKHHINISINGRISRLECSVNEAQAFLDKAISEDPLSNKKLYFFDKEAKKYIIFRKHENNKYHGYHESDSQSIPNSVRRHFEG